MIAVLFPVYGNRDKYGDDSKVGLGVLDGELVRVEGVKGVKDTNAVSAETLFLFHLILKVPF